MTDRRMAVATFGGGCFWCLEAVVEELAGVERVVSGYAGGRTDSPSYEAVCAGVTGHAEVIQVHFDPTVLSYEELLRVFFAFHDPTTLNRQGPDVGTQYRSVILTGDEGERTAALAVIADLEREGVFGAPIVTEVAPLERFWPAEDYHQGYFRKHPERGYCAAMIAPKVAKLRARYADRLRRGPAGP